MRTKIPFTLLLFSISVLTAQVADSYESTLNEMIRVSGTGEAFIASVQQMKNMFKNQFTDINDNDWNEIEEYINRESFPNLIKQLKPVYQKHLTEEDLKLIITFYKSEAGKKFAIKTPFIAQESMMVGQQWGIELGQKIKELAKKQQ
jgi:hypothetical protein